MTLTNPGLTLSILLAATPLFAGQSGDGARMAHDAYLAAINSSDLERFLDTVTEDIVFIPPGGTPLDGKPAVSAWAGAYFDAVDSRWYKTPLEVMSNGDWAWERYSYAVTHVLRSGGVMTLETGHGINLYRQGTDGSWRVARDIWVADTSGGNPADQTSCSTRIAPC